MPPIEREPAPSPEGGSELIPVQDPPALPPSEPPAPAEPAPSTLAEEVLLAPPETPSERPERRERPQKTRPSRPKSTPEKAPPPIAPAEPAKPVVSETVPPKTPVKEAPVKEAPKPVKPVEPVKPAVSETPKPEPVRPASTVRRGLATISVSGGSAQVVHAGKGLGAAPTSVVVKDDKGTIGLKSGDVSYTLKYEVKPEGFGVRVQSDPWSIVKHNGLSLGRTPQGPVAPARRHQLTFMRPGQSEPLVVTIIWNPTSQP